MFASKKHNSLCFLVDSGNSNAISKRVPHSIPWLSKCINSLGKAVDLTALDTRRGYFQVKVENETCDITTSTPQHGLYCFERGSFGLQNTLSTLQQTMRVREPRGQMAVCISLFRRYGRLLSLCSGEHRSSETCIIALTRRMGHSEANESQHPYKSYRLVRSGCSPRRSANYAAQKGFYQKTQGSKGCFRIQIVLPTL